MSNHGIFDTVIRGGRIVTLSDVADGDIGILDGVIAAIEAPGSLTATAKTIDVSGKIVFPGLIDCHCHFRGWEDYGLASRMAAAAGLTTIIPFAITDTENGESLPDAIDRHRAQLEGSTVLDVAFHFQLGADPRILEGIPAAIKGGVRSFKMFMAYKTRRPPVMVGDEFILRAMDLAGVNGGLIQLHCENGEVIHYLERQFQAEGRVKPTDFPDAAPPWVEGDAIQRAITLAKTSGCPTYIVHLSTQVGLQAISRARADGERIWTETCPQYLLLAAEDHEKWGPLLKIGPPLRPVGGPDREALWSGLESGVISCIGSDHSPHPKEIKELGWDNIFDQAGGAPVPYGAPSIETLAQLVYSKGVGERALPLPYVARVLSENPARIFGLYPRKGVIQVGSDADFTIVDPDQKTRITEDSLLGKAGYTPYEGWEMDGAITMSLLRGEVLMENGRVVGNPGYGRFLECGPPVDPV